MSILLVSPLSPRGKTGVKEAYLPAPHSVQDVAPSVAEKLPVGQFEHELAPVAVEYLPAMQFVHVSATEAPVALEYLPAMQFVHAIVTEDDDPTA
jgi:hypothetical protein